MFANCTSIESLCISNSVQSIYGSFIKGCTSIKKIVMPFTGNSWQYGGLSNYFGGTVPDSLSYVRVTSCDTLCSSAFNNCPKVKEIVIDDGVISIQSGALSGCNSLTTLTVPYTISSSSKSFLGYLYGASSLYTTSTYVPTTIKKVILSSSCQEIGEYAFSYCSNLEEIVIPSSVTSIGNYAFADCTNLIYITIPDSVISLGVGAFCNCKSLTINAVVIAHGKPRKYELPEEAGQFDKWEMKLTRQVAPLIKEWCDMLLFVTFKTYVVTTDSNKKKATGGKRVIYTNHHPTFDAKNRFNLPDELDLDFKQIAHIFPKDVEEPQKKEELLFDAIPAEPTIHEKLINLIKESGITEEDLQSVVAKKGQYNIEDFGFGKGYTYLGDTFQELLNLLDKFIDKGSITIPCEVSIINTSTFNNCRNTMRNFLITIIFSNNRFASTNRAFFIFFN